MDNNISKKIWLILSIISWIAFIIISGVTYYVNYHLPHGPIYDTGYTVCEDSTGSCGEKYDEDLRGLNIPNWAKFFREDKVSFLFWLGLALVAILSSCKANGVDLKDIHD